MTGDMNVGITHFKVTSLTDDARINTPLILMEDAEKLRQDLHAICKWASENSMTSNTNKFDIRYRQTGSPRPRLYSIEGI